MCNRPSASHVIDGGMQPKVATALADSPNNDGKKSLKRRSRWDQPAEEKPSPMSDNLDNPHVIGKDILGHVNEFCNELKKMATRARERESDEERQV